MYRLFLFITILSLASIVNAQKLGIPEIEYFNRRQYGGGTQNWKVSQSDNDLIYFANNNGLVEYDGVKWKLHTHMGDGGLRSVKCIDDRIYIGTDDDLGYFEYDSHNHLSYVSLANNTRLKDLGEAWTILSWNEKVVFHTEAAIIIFDNDEVASVIPSVSRFISAFVVNEMLLVNDEQEGLLEVRGGKIYPVSGGEAFAEKNIASIMALSNRELLVGTMHHGAYVWDMNNVRPWDGEANEFLKNANIFSGVRYNDELMLFGTIQSGIVITNMAGELVMVIDKDKGLMNNTVLGLFVDKEGGVWCGLDNGIARIALNNNVSFLSGYYNLGTGYVQERYKGDWFFGTNQALFKIDDRGFRDPLKDRSDFVRIAGTDGQVWSIHKEDNQLLCGHNLGVFEINDETSRLITPSSVNGVWNFLPVNDNSDLMISGTYNGLILFERKNEKWQFKQHIDGFSESSRYIEWDKLGRLWVSHSLKGVYCLSFSNDYTIIEDVKSYSKEELPGSNSLVVRHFNEQTIIVANNGLFYINDKGEIQNYKQLDHFFEPNQYPYSINEDRFKNLWLFYHDYVEVLRYLEDGTYKKIALPFIPLERKLVSGFESVYVLDRENVFFGIEDGYAHYLMQDYNNLRIPFKVHLRSFVGKNDSLPYTLLQKDDAEVQQAVVPVYPFRQNYFEIEYAATFYGDKEIEYSTFLSGFDDRPSDWNPATSRQFTKLKEGDYYFTIKARNKFGIQSIPLTFHFKILPPWHRHVYAKIAYLVFILIIAFVLTVIFNRKIEVSRQKEKLKAHEKYKEKEERLTNEALQAEKEMIKMRNDKLRSEMKFKEDELAGLTVHIIQKNNLLSELQGQLKRIKRIKVHDESERKIDNLIKKIDKDIDNESNWQLFENQFEQVHHTFLTRLVEKHSDLTDKERKLCAYIRMGMASKEIASLMNISTRSVENNRYKLRQKLGLMAGDDLSKYISEV